VRGNQKDRMLHGHGSHGYYEGCRSSIPRSKVIDIRKQCRFDVKLGGEWYFVC